MLGSLENEQPIVKIEVGGMYRTVKKLDAIIDSGFSGSIQMPYPIAFPLGLVLMGVDGKTLADGSVSTHLVCQGTVSLDGASISTSIDLSDANIVIIGVKLLKELQKRFILDCVSGRVEIIDGKM